MINIYNTKDFYKSYRKEGGKLTYREYKDIIDDYHKKVSSLVMSGFIYDMPSEICTLKIIENKRKIKVKENGNLVCAVDWGESNKNKALLIENGKVPYKETKLEDGTITNNGGEKWLCYHTDDSYFIWIKISSIKLHNAMKYSFNVSWTNARALAKIDREEADLMFNKRKGNGTSRDYLKRILIAASGQDVQFEQFKLARRCS